MYDHGSQREDVPFLPLLLGLAAWPLCRIASDRFVRWYSPDFYKHLKSDYERRYLFFFGLLLGLIARPPSLVACSLSVLKTAAEDDIAGFPRPMNTYQQFCWGTRTVMYISELPHFLHLPEMVLHHLLTLLGMAIIANYHGPRRGYDLCLAALCSEVTNSTRSLLKQTNYGKKHPNTDWNLQFYGTVSLYLTRVPAVIISIAMIPASGLEAAPARIAASAFLFYIIYVHRLTYKRLRNSDILQIEDSGVFRVRIGNQLNITSTSLLTGLAILGTQMSVIALYAWTKMEPVAATTPELINLIWNSLFAVAVGLAGSRLTAPSLQRILQWQRMSSVYLQSGLIFAILFLYLSPTLDAAVDKKTLTACLLLSSSLTKAVSQYASHLACIENGSQTTATPKQYRKRTAKKKMTKKLPPRASLICSFINVCQYLAFVSAVVTRYSSSTEAAFRSLLLQLVIRAAVDFTLGKSGYNMPNFGSLIILKMIWGLGGIVTASALQLDHDGNHDYTRIIGDALITRAFVPPDWRMACKFALKDILVLQVFYLLVSVTARYFSTARRSLGFTLPRSRTMALASLAAWLCYIGYAIMAGEEPEVSNRNFTAAEIVARQPPFCSLLLSWQFWVSVSASVSVPTVAAHLWLPRAVSQAKEVRSDSFWDQE